MEPKTHTPGRPSVNFFAATPWRVLLCVVSCLFLTVSCNAIIDLEEDCAQRNACGEFRCAEDNVACKSTCSADRDCSLGATCAASSCVYSSCTPNFSRTLIGAFDDDIESATILNLSGIGVYVAIVEAGDRLFEIAMNVENGRIVNQVTSIISDGPSADFVFGVVPLGDRGAVALWSRARIDVSSLKLRRYSFSAEGAASVELADVPFGDASDLTITSVSLESSGDEGVLVVNTSGSRPEVFASTIRLDSVDPLVRQHPDGFSGRQGTAHLIDGDLLVAFLESDSTGWRERLRDEAKDDGTDVAVAGGRLPTPLNFVTYSAFDTLFRATIESGEPVELNVVYPPGERGRTTLAEGANGVVGVSLDDSGVALGELVLGDFPNGTGLYFRYLSGRTGNSPDYTRVVEATSDAEISNYFMDQEGQDVAVFWAEQARGLKRSDVFVSSFSCQ